MLMYLTKEPDRRTVGLTENELLNLRRYICSPYQSLNGQAMDLGIKPGTLKVSLSLIRDQVLSHESIVEKTNSKNIPLRVLERHFDFIKILGDHTVNLNPAITPPFWQS